VYGAPANIISRTYRWICRGTHWLFSPASPGRESHRWCSGQLYAEAQRRYLESVSPYARRLFHQMAVPQVDAIDGLPPAVALQQQRGSPTTRSSVGSVTTLSNLLRMLYSRAGDYPRDQPLLYAESFSTNTVEGACPECHGIGGVHQVTEKSMVPDDSLTIRQRAIAAWPTARGQNLRDILVTLGYDVDRPWRELPKKDRNWILFTEEQPTVPVYAGYTPAEVRRALKRKDEPTCQGTFTSARKHVLQTFDVFVGAPLLTRAHLARPRHLLWCRLGGGHKSRCRGQACLRDCHHVHGSHGRDPARRALRRLVRPDARLARGVLGSDRHWRDRLRGGGGARARL
jgi:excinuclease UvrABC ATPase subunit